MFYFRVVVVVVQNSIIDITSVGFSRSHLGVCYLCAEIKLQLLNPIQNTACDSNNIVDAAG